MRDGVFRHPGSEGKVPVFEVAPTKAFAYDRGGNDSATRYRFRLTSDSGKPYRWFRTSLDAVRIGAGLWRDGQLGDLVTIERESVSEVDDVTGKVASGIDRS